MVTVYVLRHAQSVGNRFGIRQGQLDFPLSVDGLEQAKQVENVLPDEITTVYTSDLRRASETAKYGLTREFTHKETPLLRELDFGQLSGTAQSAYDDRLPYALDDHPSVDEPWPDGESARDAYERVKEFCHRIVQEHENDETIAVVSHQGTMFNFRDLSREAEPMEQSYDEQENVNGFVFTIEIDSDGGVVLSEDREVDV